MVLGGRLTMGVSLGRINPGRKRGVRSLGCNEEIYARWKRCCLGLIWKRWIVMKEMLAM